jgi:uncharacterized protein YqeY
MSIREQIKQSKNNALRSGNKREKNVAQSILSQIDDYIIDNGLPRQTYPDDISKKVVDKYYKGIKKALKAIENGGRGDSDLAEDYRYELDYCRKFLPNTLSDKQVKDIIIKEVNDNNLTNIGQTIGHIMKKYKGLDGSVVKDMVKEVLNK